MRAISVPFFLAIFPRLFTTIFKLAHDNDWRGAQESSIIYILSVSFFYVDTIQESQTHYFHLIVVT